jgi:hypothetical protein
MPPYLRTLKGHGMRHPMKWASWGLSLAVVLAVSVALAAAVKHTDPGRDYSQSNGFSFVPPEGWNKLPSAPAGTFVAYVDPNVQGGFTTNMNVNSQADDGADLAKSLPEIKKALGALFKDYKAVDEGKTNLNGRAAIYLSSKFTLGEIPAQNLQYYIRGANKKLYVVTFTTRAADFAKSRLIFAKCAQTALTD